MSAISCGTFCLFADVERPLEVGLGLGELALRQVRHTDVVQRQRLAAAVAFLAQERERFPEERQRLVWTAESLVQQHAEVDQREARARLVADLPPERERLVVALHRVLRVSERFLDLGDFAQADSHPALLSDLPLDGQRLLVLLQRVGRLAHELVRDADRLQHVGPRLVVPELNRQAQRVVQRLERRLRVAALDRNPADGGQRVNVLRVERDGLCEALLRLGQVARALVEPGQIELDPRVVRGHLRAGSRRTRPPSCCRS